MRGMNMRGKPVMTALTENYRRETDPMFHAIQRAAARALIRLQQRKFEAEYKQMLIDTGRIVVPENCPLPDPDHTP